MRDRGQMRDASAIPWRQEPSVPPRWALVFYALKCDLVRRRACRVRPVAKLDQRLTSAPSLTLRLRTFTIRKRLAPFLEQMTPWRVVLCDPHLQNEK